VFNIFYPNRETFTENDYIDFYVVTTFITMNIEKTSDLTFLTSSLTSVRAMQAYCDRK